MTPFPVRLTSATTPPSDVEADWLVVGVVQDRPPDAALDLRLGGQLTRLREAGDLTGKPLDLVAIRSPAGLRARRLLLVGLGPADRLSRANVHDGFAAALRSVTGRKFARIA